MLSQNNQIGPESSATQLVSGILSDAQDLFKEQLHLFREEMQQDVQKVKQASLALAGGLGIFFVAGILLAFMLVHLLSILVPTLPLWACFGLVGIPISILGAALCYWGYQEISLANLLPKQSTQALKENVRCLTNSK